jgi:hypothetical protein
MTSSGDPPEELIESRRAATTAVSLAAIMIDLPEAWV